MNSIASPRHVVLISCLGFLLCLATNIAAGAQGSEDSRVSAALQSVAPGTPVRVLSRSALIVEGTILRLSHREVVVGVEPLENTSVSLDDIDTVWAKDNQRNRGAIRGMLLGGLVGGVILSVQASPVDPAALFVFGAAAGVYGGLLIGSMIGSQVPKWELIFKRR